MSYKQIISEYRKSLKSMDTEEHIDLFFYRPIGFLVAKASAALHITPNALTIISIILGIGAGACIYPPGLAINVGGLLLLMAANVLDSADGQLARLTKQYSRLGRILDGVAGDIWFFCIYLAICLREVDFPTIFAGHTWIIWVLGSVAGASHIRQAQMADYYRQFHLSLLSGKNTISEMENVEELQRHYDSLSWTKNFSKKLLQKVYLTYTKLQNSTTPALILLRRNLQLLPDAQAVQMRHELRHASLPLMKYTNILSFNWRYISLAFSVLIGQPWLYFVLEITVFNVILIYMHSTHEKICRNANAKIAQL